MEGRLFFQDGFYKVDLYFPHYGISQSESSIEDLFVDSAMPEFVIDSASFLILRPFIAV